MKCVIPIPLIAGYLTSFLCPMSKKAGSKISFRPPAYIFGIVWPILYILVGFSWYYSFNRNTNILFIINTVLCCLWLVFYSCMGNKIYALWNLFLLQLCNLYIIFYLLQIKQYKSIYLLLPYMMWIIFAILLNIFDIN